MKRIDEGFFKDAYQKYRAKVLGILQKNMGIVVPAGFIHSVEDWIRDYFVDKFDELDCARSIRDNFKNQFALGESMKLDEAVKMLKKSGALIESANGSTDRSWFEISKKHSEEEIDAFVEEVYQHVEPDVETSWSNTTDQVYLEFDEHLSGDDVLNIFKIAKEQGITITDFRIHY